VLRILVRILLVVILLVVVVVGGVLGRGAWLTSRKIDRRVPELTVAKNDSALVARGEHLASVVCAGCHGVDEALPLTGGTDFFKAGGPPFGSLIIPNLTPSGNLQHYSSDGLLLRAIREGISHEGRALVMMPSADYHDLGDRDAVALIAYLRSQAPQGTHMPHPSLNAMGLAVVGLGMFKLSDQPAIEGVVEAPAIDSTAEYGGYLTHVLGCRNCHGATLHGAVKGQFEPMGPDLVGLAAAHPPQIFERALRGGISTQGLALDPTKMPWRTYSRLDDLEVKALYAYLKAGAN